jgi:hypothetical protein
MILRRLTEHFRTQNWFAVTLDLAVVVVGIYIGLQADAWMSGQQDRVLEQEYLQRLLADMEESAVGQRDLIIEFEQSINAMDYLADRLHKRSFEDVDPAQIRLAIDALGWVPQPVTSMGTLRELQSTGNISLLQDVDVRKALGSLDLSYSSAEFSTSHNLSLISTSMPVVMPWVYIYPAGEVGTYKATLDEVTYGADQAPDYERMLADPDAANSVSWISGWSKYHASIMLQHHVDTLEFRDLLRERIQMQASSKAP